MGRRSKYPRFIFLIIGVLVLIVAFQMTDKTKREEFWVSTLQNVALIALTVVIVEFLWDLAGGDPVTESIAEVRDTLTDLKSSVTLLGDSQRTGLQRVYANSNAVDVEFWRTQLLTAQKKVELMGYTLYIWTKTPSFEKIVVDQAKRGVHFKLLLMSPDNPELAAFINPNIGVTVAAVREEVKAAIGAFKSIQARLAGTTGEQNFELRILQQGLIVTQIARFDNLLTSIQYLYSAVASRTPLLQVGGTKSALFERYVEEFDRLWDAGTAA